VLSETTNKLNEQSVEENKEQVTSKEVLSKFSHYFPTSFSKIVKIAFHSSRMEFRMNCPRCSSIKITAMKTTTVLVCLDISSIV